MKMSWQARVQDLFLRTARGACCDPALAPQPTRTAVVRAL